MKIKEFFRKEIEEMLKDHREYDKLEHYRNLENAKRREKYKRNRNRKTKKD